MKLIERVGEPSIFVAIARLRKCYPELPDTSWTGRKRSRKRQPKRRTVAPTPVDPVMRMSGPITRSMTRRNQAQD